jgi:tripartite-type tricarboxylate transporter receptor subunit TctC
MLLRRLWLCAVFLCAAVMAQAQTATAALTIVVPYLAGGPLDTAAHILADVSQARLGSITVRNTPGEGGNLGADAVAKAPQGSNMLVLGSVGTHATNPWLYPHFPYDPVKDFKPILLVGRAPAVLLMNAEQAQRLKIHTTADLVAYLRAHPEPQPYGAGGKGSISHIAAEMFKLLTHTHLSYTQFESAGSAEALQALQANKLVLVFDNLASSLELVKSGRLTALGVTSLSRNEELPKVPSINEDVPGFNVVTWFGLFAPVSLPDADAQRYAAAFAMGMQSPAGKEKFRQIGVTPEDMRLQEFGRFQQSELRKYGFLVKTAKIKMD